MAYEDLNKEELQDELRERELPVSGTKDELIARLEEDDDALVTEPEPDDGPDGDKPEPEEGNLKVDVDAVLREHAEVSPELIAWREANPDATAIPPTLLPDAYQDGTVATPGMPAGVS